MVATGKKVPERNIMGEGDEVAHHRRRLGAVGDRPHKHAQRDEEEGAKEEKRQYGCVQRDVRPEAVDAHRDHQEEGDDSDEPVPDDLGHEPLALRERREGELLEELVTLVLRRDVDGGEHGGRQYGEPYEAGDQEVDVLVVLRLDRQALHAYDGRSVGPLQVEGVHYALGDPGDDGAGG